MKQALYPKATTTGFFHLLPSIFDGLKISPILNHLIQPMKLVSNQPCFWLFQAELADYWGYQFEEHHVLTSDGYILGIHRVPGPKGEGPVKVAKPIALLAHGLLSSSSQWIFGPAYNSMGYALADEGV